MNAKRNKGKKVVRNHWPPHARPARPKIPKNKPTIETRGCCNAYPIRCRNKAVATNNKPGHQFLSDRPRSSWRFHHNSPKTRKGMILPTLSSAHVQFWSSPTVGFWL